MISANELCGKRRVRLTKAVFANIQKQLERFAREQLPQLQTRLIYDRSERSAVKVTKNEGELIRRTGKASKRREIADILLKQLPALSSLENVKAHIEAQGWTLYQRGKTYGVVVEGKKYRLKTLGCSLGNNQIDRQSHRKHR